MDAKLTWLSIKHFRSKEFDSPDAPGSGRSMNLEFVELLDQIREACGFPFHITSGYRTLMQNRKVEGVDGSSHLTGLACDIQAESSVARYSIVKHALLAGVRRIGIGKTFVHLDVDPSKPQGVVWLY